MKVPKKLTAGLIAGLLALALAGPAGAQAQPKGAPEQIEHERGTKGNIAVISIYPETIQKNGSIRTFWRRVDHYSELGTHTMIDAELMNIDCQTRAWQTLVRMVSTEKHPKFVEMDQSFDWYKLELATSMHSTRDRVCKT